MVISKSSLNGNIKRVASLNPESFDVTGFGGMVRIDMTDWNSDWKYRIALPKQQAIELLKELYAYLEDGLETDDEDPE